MRHILISSVLLSLSIVYISPFKPSGQVLGAATSNYAEDKIGQKIQLRTQTAFDQKEDVVNR